MSVGRAQYAQKNQNTTSFRGTKKGIGPVSNTIVLIVLACLLGLFYLAQVTKTNSFGYQISELSQKHSSLQEEHDQLEVASARLQALDRVKNSKQAKNLVTVAPVSAISN